MMSESTSILFIHTLEFLTLITKSSTFRIRHSEILGKPIKEHSLPRKVHHNPLRTRQNKGKVRTTGVNHQGIKNQKRRRSQGIHGQLVKGTGSLFVKVKRGLERFQQISRGENNESHKGPAVLGYNAEDKRNPCLEPPNKRSKMGLRFFICPY